ncbi:transposase [Thermodesulfobacteriota bacterium]
MRDFARADAHIMTDKSRSHQNIVKSYMAYDLLNHGAKELVRGDVHINTTESFGAFLERAKQGVYHYISENQLSRYLNEISFCWNNRVPDKQIFKNGKKKIKYKTMPVVDLLSSILRKAVGRQIRRSYNGGIFCLQPEH